jgi:polar amino acid transport system substrate-binding protein
LLLSGCGKKDPPLIVLTTGTNAPFSIADKNNNLSGFDIDLIRLVAGSIGREIEIKCVPFDEILTQVQTRKGDIAIGAISITDERMKSVDFSPPYHEGGFAMVMLETTSGELKDLSDKTVGVGEGTWQEGVVKAFCISTPNLFVRSVKSSQFDDIVSKIRSGELAAFVLDADSAKYLVAHTQGFKVVPLEIGILGMGIVTAKGSHHTKIVSDALAKNSEQIVSLKAKWFSAAAK